MIEISVMKELSLYKMGISYFNITQTTMMMIANFFLVTLTIFAKSDIIDFYIVLDTSLGWTSFSKFSLHHWFFLFHGSRQYFTMEVACQLLFCSTFSEKQRSPYETVLQKSLHWTMFFFFQYVFSFTRVHDILFIYLFIYLLTLLKVNYKTLAAYALIKIDYPPLP